jgi:hypothetical protein
MKLALCEPHFYKVHGGSKSNGKYLCVYEYDLAQFYNDEWKGDKAFHWENLVNELVHKRFNHDLLRNYRKGIRTKSLLNLHLVETQTDPIGGIYCVQHTYKLNLFKRLWRKRRLNRGQAQTI